MLSVPELTIKQQFIWLEMGVYSKIFFTGSSFYYSLKFSKFKKTLLEVFFTLNLNE